MISYNDRSSLVTKCLVAHLELENTYGRIGLSMNVLLHGETDLPNPPLAPFVYPSHTSLKEY
jgi:hypothetical protein